MEDLPIDVRQKYDELVAAGHYKECEDYLSQQTKKIASTKIRLTLATLQYGYLAKTISAEKLLLQLNEEYPEEQEVKICLADLYYLLYRDEEAISFYTQVKNLETLAKPHWKQLINIYIRKGNLENARAEMQALMEFSNFQIDLDDFYLLLKILLKLNLVEEAIKYTNEIVKQPLSKDQLAFTAEQFSTHGYRDIANNIMNIASNINNQDQGLFYKQKVLFYKLPELYKGFCQGGQDFLDLTGVQENATFEPGQLIEVWCVVFGKEHIEMLEKVSLPTLFYSDGFDELLKERKLIFNIYTVKENLMDLWPIISLLQARQIGFRINLTLLDSVIDPVHYQGPFAFNALTLLDQIRRSIKYKSIILSVLPDLLMQGGSLKTVIDNMKPNDFVVCRGPRINSEVAVPEIINYYQTNNKKYDDKEFIKLCMTKFIHPQTEVGLNSDNHLLTIKKHTAGYEIQTACPQPLCFYGQQKMIDKIINNPGTGHRILSSFFCIDNDFIDMAYRDNELVYIQDSNVFFWAELTGMKNHQLHQFFRGWADANSSYYPEGYRYCREQTVLWRCEV